MSATIPNFSANDAREPSLRTGSPGDSSLRESLDRVELMLDDGERRLFDGEYFEALASEFCRLHARVRIHHAAGRLSAAQIAAEVPVESADELERLLSEHTVIIGQLDRLVRCVESMADRTLEDKEVFFLRGRELIALVRRHEAEEDRLFYLAIWRDTGGES